MKRLLFLLVLLAAESGAGLFASEFLVSTDWLAQNLNNPRVKIVEVSVNPGVYEQGHIPGAVNFRWHSDLVDPVVRDIAQPEDFADLLSRSGISPDDTVVIYGDTNNWFAAWGAWIFDIYGHRDFRLLDGGRNKWEAERRPLTTAPARPRRTTYRISGTNSELRARLQDVVAAAEGRSQAKIIDIRSADEYQGKVFAPAGVQELSIRAGHVPGAVNVPWGRAVNSDGTFKSPGELERLYRGVGVTGEDPVIVYCRIGERSSHTWFALSKILGYEVKNYDGSWTEYGNSVGVPITNVAGTVWGGK
ncbi:sulfurtransferase [Spirochaeta lutea]|uniref:Sulfurtransferase n=1 Tax=Spirochaeta lutea TaxID=1480694 RepID=A0A098QZ87_9SPIO|nr:sulfurtransferase [Spirochaeta lutea]KGE72753.1 thiosulfate sulfurtransferase [Spirochaeta lutea]